MSSGSSSYLPVGSPVIEGPPATALRKRSAESAWRKPGYAAEVRREMALAREARGVGDIVDRPVLVPEKIARALDPSFHHVTVGRPSCRISECLAKVMRAQLDDRGQLDEPELVGQMRLDVLENAPNLPRRKPAPLRDWRTPRQSRAAKQMDRQGRGQSLGVSPPARAALVQLEPAERGEPTDHRIFNTDRCSDEAIAGAIEVLPPYLRDESFLDRESEEGRRRVATTPKGKTPVPDVNAAMRDGT